MPPTNIHNLTEQADTTQAIAFLRALDPEGWHNLVAIDPDAAPGAPNKVIARTFGPSEYDNMANFVEAYQGKRNLYFSVNEPSPDSPNNKLKKEHIVAVRAVYIDVDPHSRSEDEYASERTKIADLHKQLADDWLCPPTAVIDSGGGYQFFWFLSHKIPADIHRDWAEAQGNALAIAFGGDSTFDVNRIMRLPGTVNLPDATKRARGRKRAPTKLISLLDGPDNRYGHDVLASWYKPVTPIAIEKSGKYPDLDPGEIMQVGEWGDLPEALADRFRALQEKNKELNALWRGDPLTGDDQSGSAYLWSLAYHLKRDGSFTPTEFGMIAMSWDYANLHSKTDPIRQIARAWARHTVESAAEQFGIVELEPQKKAGLFFMMADAAADEALSTGAKPLIKGILDQGAMSVLYGESNSGKTFIMLDMAHHIATGTPWNNLRTAQGLVIYVAAEGGAGIKKRLSAIRMERGALGELAVVPCPIDLFNPHGDTKRLIELVKSAEEARGQPATLIVIDTLSRALAGGDENSSTDMGALVKNLDKIRAETKAHLAVVHHSGKDKSKGARGHSLLRAATDTEIEIADKTITVQKQRDMEPLPPTGFQLKPINLGLDPEGESVVSCVVTFNEVSEQAFERLALTPAEQAFYYEVVDLAVEKCELLGWEPDKYTEIKLDAKDFLVAYEAMIKAKTEGNVNLDKSLKNNETAGRFRPRKSEGTNRYARMLRNSLEEKGYSGRIGENQWVITPRKKPEE